MFLLENQLPPSTCLFFTIAGIALESDGGLRTKSLSTSSRTAQFLATPNIHALVSKLIEKLACIGICQEEPDSGRSRLENASPQASFVMRGTLPSTIAQEEIIQNAIEVSNMAVFSTVQLSLQGHCVGPTPAAP
ncbi:hypothetical protein D5086_000625 [Populus alba]|uniref:Uncharacterized protein n=1 Tax=Populus alba TaxID=43335 RepID=A0ACC4CWM7_POPAL